MDKKKKPQEEAQNRANLIGSMKKFQLQSHQDNIILRPIIEDLFDNLDNIPASELEKFINQYKKS